MPNELTETIALSAVKVGDRIWHAFFGKWMTVRRIEDGPIDVKTFSAAAGVGPAERQLGKYFFGDGDDRLDVPLDDAVTRLIS